jgi:hypothetical protein
MKILRFFIDGMNACGCIFILHIHIHAAPIRHRDNLVMSTAATDDFIKYQGFNVKDFSKNRNNRCSSISKCGRRTTTYCVLAFSYHYHTNDKQPLQFSTRLIQLTVVIMS